MLNIRIGIWVNRSDRLPFPPHRSRGARTGIDNLLRDGRYALRTCVSLGRGAGAGVGKLCSFFSGKQLSLYLRVEAGVEKCFEKALCTAFLKQNCTGTVFFFSPFSRFRKVKKQLLFDSAAQAFRSEDMKGRGLEKPWNDK